MCVRIQKLQEKSVEWAGVSLAIVADMDSVDLCLHQDAILDLAKEATTWVTKLQSKASKLMGPLEEGGGRNSKRVSGGLPGTSSPGLSKLRSSGLRRLSRQSSGETVTNQPRLITQRRKVNRNKKEVVDLMVAAGIRGIINFSPATVTVPDEVVVKNIDLTIEFMALLCDLRM